MSIARRQPARAGSCAARPAHPHPLYYERHRPEQTTLYRLVQQHAAHFIAHTAASTGAEMPRFIKEEFDAFLECGIRGQCFQTPFRLPDGNLKVAQRKIHILQPAG